MCNNLLVLGGLASLVSPVGGRSVLQEMLVRCLYGDVDSYVGRKDGQLR